MSIAIGDIMLRNRALLAPMAGITDLPFRQLAARFGAALTTSEMVASGELVTGRASTATKADIDPALGPAAVQIAGREAGLMAEAARIAEGGGAEIIDINMGCPAKKVTTGLSGSALMRDLDHALTLIDAVANAVRAPVTLKMRLGWDETSINAPELAKRAENAGVRLVTVHGRTRQQFYKGAADWRAVAAVKAAIGVPLVVNGDIATAADARTALAQSGADAVMIGRAAQGAPWVPAMIGAALEGRAFEAPDQAARLGLAIEHYEAMLSHYGRELGARVARKHLSWALEREPGAEALRARIVRMREPEDVILALRGGFDAAPTEREAA